jgi:serine protease Do
MNSTDLARMTRAGLLAGIAGFGLLSIAALPAAAQSSRPIAISPPAGAPISFADLIDRVSPAVVSVEVVTETSERVAQRFSPFRGLPGFENEQDGGQDGEEGVEPESNREGRALGSGFFISSDGFIVTNNHVVANAREVVVSLKDGVELQADIIGTDPQTDLAVLKVRKAGNYAFVQFATRSRPRVGDWVVAVGNPFGLGGTATAGIVSATGRELANEVFTDFIQVDAPINRGNSGGPTFNLNGEVIGVNTAIFSDTGGGSVGIGFAIEAEAAKKITDTLIKDGKVVRGWLGVEIQNVDQRVADAWGLKNNKGALVSRVTRGGPAETAGIRSEDIIIAVNDQAVDNFRDLTRKVSGLIAGSRNTFKVVRQGREETLSVTVREREESALRRVEPNPARDKFEKPKAAAGDVDVLGGTVRPLSAADRVRFEHLDAAREAGLLVVTVADKSPLAEADISPGDALLSVNQRPLKSTSELMDAIAAAKRDGKADIVLMVGCGNREACGDSSLLRPVKIK